MKSSLTLVLVLFLVSSCQNNKSANQENTETIPQMTDEQEDSLYLQVAQYLFSQPSNDRERQQNEIIKYALNHDLNIKYDERGFFYSYSSRGDGTPVAWGDKVSLHYTGRFLDGETFDSSLDRGKPLEFVVGTMIPGFNFGLMHFNEGGKGHILLPAHLAYGEEGFGDIPPQTPLIFELEQIKVLRKRSKE